ncbi:hypothetical protein E4U36_001994 [Claviceps purpurea]|nr:hypothetical protein E4U36_001994 [Claviceps purpurea]
MKYTCEPGTTFGVFLAEFNSLCQKADVPSSKMKQELWDVIPADMDSSPKTLAVTLGMPIESRWGEFAAPGTLDELSPPL